jgi:NADH:ubiquinone reductase (H+-translocating)
LRGIFGNDKVCREAKGIGERIVAKQIVILGAGYGGLKTALETSKLLTEDVAKVTIVNRYPFHQIVTELHQPAAGRIEPQKVKLPLSKLLDGKKVDVLLAEVERIAPDEHTVYFKDGSTIKYDLLVVGLGSETEFFGIQGLAEHSFILKSVDDATRINNHIDNCVKAYSETGDEANITFGVGGAGLSGIELVGEIADMMPEICGKYGVDPSLVKLYSIEAAPTILPGFPQTLVDRARTSLEERGVQFLTGMPIVQMEAGRVHLKSGEVINTKTLIWTGGVRGNSIVAASGIAVDGRGRAQINEFLQSTSHQDVFVVGDSAIVMGGPNGRPYPPTAQIAGQMGIHAGQQIANLLSGAALQAFQPHLQGTLASLGRKDAIGMVGANKRELTGKAAGWLKEASQLRYLWQIGGLFVHSAK